MIQTSTSRQNGGWPPVDKLLKLPAAYEVASVISWAIVRTHLADGQLHSGLDVIHVSGANCLPEFSQRYMKLP